MPEGVHSVRAGDGYMNATTFDTCAAAKRLRDAGFDEDQAEATP